MKKSDQLKLERTAKVEAQGKLLATAKAENRDLNDAENTSFDTLDGEIRVLDTQIERAVKIEAAELRSLELDGKQPLNSEVKQPKEKRIFSISRVIRSLVSGEALGEVETTAHNRGLEIARASGVPISPDAFVVPMNATRADGQTITQDTGGYGGNSVATDVMEPIDYLTPNPVLQKLGAVFLTDLKGNIQFPKNNGGIVATWEDEDAAVSNTKMALGKVEMAPRRLSVSVPISLQTLNQSSFSVDTYIMNQIKKAITLEIDKDGLYAILNNSDVNSVVMGTNGGAPTWPKIVEFDTKIDAVDADSDNLSFVSNAKLKGKLKTTVKESGQPIYIMNDDTTVNGYPFLKSNLIPSNLTKGTASQVCSAAIFGDFSKLVLGQWGFMDLSVDNFSRKKEGYVEITANVYLDSAVLEPKAFAVCKDLLTS